MQNRTALVLATPAEGEELATEVPVELVRCPACPPPLQRPSGRDREKECAVDEGEEWGWGVRAAVTG